MYKRQPANIASVIAPPLVKFVHLTGTPRAFAKFFFCMSSRFGLGHSRKYATLTSVAAEFATEIERLRAKIDPRIKLSIFSFIPLC